MEVLTRLFEQHFRSPVECVQPLQGQLGGSGRKIIRLSSEKLSAIGILYDVREENVAFLEFSRHFRRHGLPVPEIYAADLNHGAYLEEDFGAEMRAPRTLAEAVALEQHLLSALREIRELKAHLASSDTRDTSSEKKST